LERRKSIEIRREPFIECHLYYKNPNLHPMHLSLSYYMIYKENEKQKKEENYIKIHKWEKIPLKTLLPLF